MFERISAFLGYAGCTASCAFGLSVGQWQAVGVAGGLLIGVAGFAFNAWLGWRRDQREERGIR